MTAERRTDPIAAARAAEQAESRSRRVARDQRIAEHFAAGVPGRGLIRGNLAATIVMVVVSLLGVIDYDRFAYAAAVVDLVLFGLGVVSFCVALWLGAQRSRRSVMGIGGWFFLSGTAPAAARRPLLGALAVQVVVGIAAGIATLGAATSAGDQATKLAFGTLVPVLGLAVCGWWGARYGLFPDRVE